MSIWSCRFSALGPEVPDYRSCHGERPSTELAAPVSWHDQLTPIGWSQALTTGNVRRTHQVLGSTILKALINWLQAYTGYVDGCPANAARSEAGPGEQNFVSKCEKQNWASLVMSCAKAHHSVKSTGNHEERNTKVNLVKQRYSVCMGEWLSLMSLRRVYIGSSYTALALFTVSD